MADNFVAVQVEEAVPIAEEAEVLVVEAEVEEAVPVREQVLRRRPSKIQPYLWQP